MIISYNGERMHFAPLAAGARTNFDSEVATAVLQQRQL